MMALGGIDEEVERVRAALEAAQLELMSLQSEPQDEEPPGCATLRELLAEANQSGQAQVATFLNAELAVVLSCARAAMGDPDWEGSLRTSHYVAQEEAESEDEDEEEEVQDLMFG